MSKAVQRTLEAKLAALQGPEWDSSDEETPMVPLESSTKTSSSKSSKSSSKVSKQGAKKQTKQKQQQLEESPDTASRVIYLGHLPRDFEEPELRGFLQQFGVVTNIQLSRSKRTANSRGYAFCEFATSKTAAIVAETMNGYLMSQKKLVCHVVPNDKIHPSLFEHADKKFVKMDWRGMHREKVNSTKNASQMQRITRQLLKRERKKRQKVKEMGIDYDFPGYKESAKEMDEKKRACGDDAAEKEATSKKRRTESDDNENADSSNLDERENSEEETKDSAGGGSDKKKSKEKKHRKMSDASDSSKAEKKKRKRKMSDASLEEGKETKPAQTPKPAAKLDNKKEAAKSEETKAKRSKKAAKKRRAST